MVDAYTKYMWVRNMNADTTSNSTLVTLFEWFCEPSGFPVTLVSDNGTQFSSNAFKQRMQQWGIKHLFSPPYHPASNGLAEKAVHIIKDKLKKMDAPIAPLSLQFYISDILRMYRGTVHSTTGSTPFELMKHSNVPSLFPNLMLKHKNNVMPARNRAKVFQVGDKVLVFDKMSKTNSKGIVTQVQSRNTYIVQINGVPKHISGDNMTISDIDNESIVNDSDKNSDLDSISIVSDDSSVDISDDHMIGQQFQFVPDLTFSNEECKLNCLLVVLDQEQY